MTGTFATMRTIDADSLRARLDMAGAVRALQSALRSGYDPDDDPARTIVDVGRGQLLIMPGRVGPLVGQKLVSVAPGNPARGLERIQGLYILFDGETLTPAALLDGAELTALRTPAVSAAAVDLLAAPDASRLVVYGTGPQGVRHIEAMRAIRPITRVRLVGRDPRRLADAVAASAASGLDVAAGSPADVRDADIVVCATTARTPLPGLDDVRDDAVVVAVGSHETDARELPGSLVGRAHVVVESRRVALAEAGDVVMAIAEGQTDAASLIPLAALFSGHVPANDRPRIVKTCGMGWEDLVVADAAMAGGTSSDGTR